MSTSTKAEASQNNNPDETASPKKKLFSLSVVFWVLTAGILLWGFYHVKTIYMIRTDPKYSSWMLNPISNIYITLIATPLLGVIRFVMEHSMKGYFLANLDPKKYSNEEELQKKLHIVLRWFREGVYHFFVGVIGWSHFRNYYILPDCLWGATHSKCIDAFNFWPNLPHIPYLDLYYMLQMSWYILNMIESVVEEIKKKNFKMVEYMMHHFSTIFLIFYSYMFNFTGNGVIVLVIFDFSDIFLFLTRLLNELKNTPRIVLHIIYPIFVIVYILLRVFIFGGCVIKASITYFIQIKSNYEQDVVNAIMYMIVMLLSLFLLNVFWSYYILKIFGALFIKKAEDANIYDKKRK